MKRLNLSLDSQQEKHMREISVRTGRPQSEVVRNLIDSGIQSDCMGRNIVPEIQGRALNWGKLIMEKPEGYEKEVLQEGEKDFKNSGLQRMGTHQIPFSVLNQNSVLNQKALTAGSDAGGAYTIADELHHQSFVSLLQNKLAVKQMGATVLDNLVGDVKIPKVTAGATAVWSGENDAATESSPTFGQISLAPNRVGTYTDISKQLLVQSSLSVDHLVQNLLTDSIAAAIDLAALHGTGANNQPLGIIGTSGIGDVAGGTNGLAPALSHIVELETDIADSNAVIDDSRTGYLTNSKVRGILKMAFSNATYGDTPLWNDGKLNGYRAEVSNQVSSTLTKGDSDIASAIFFGMWGDLILANWGGLDLTVDIYTQAKNNRVIILAGSYWDVGIKNVESFSVMKDALTV